MRRIALALGYRVTRRRKMERHPFRDAVPVIDFPFTKKERVERVD